MKLVVTRSGLGSISGYELNTKKRTVWMGRQTEEDFIAEGELLEIESSKEWVFGHTHFVSGKIINHANNISAVGIDPLPVRSWIPGKLNFEMDQVIPEGRRTFCTNTSISSKKTEIENGKADLF
jgi:hypothetical protein